MAAQEQIRKILINDFGFKLISTKATGFGERWLLRSENGLEAQLGVYRVCFYGGKFVQSEDGSNGHSFPDARQPLCFDTDQKSNILSFLEQKLGVRVKVKRRSAVSKQTAPTLFEV